MRERQSQDQRATKNAEDNLRRAFGSLPPYRDELDSEITVNKSGLHAKGVPPWALGLTLVILSIGAVVYLVLRR